MSVGWSVLPAFLCLSYSKSGFFSIHFPLLQVLVFIIFKTKMRNLSSEGTF